MTRQNIVYKVNKSNTEFASIDKVEELNLNTWRNQVFYEVAKCDEKTYEVLAVVRFNTLEKAVEAYNALFAD